MVNKIYKYIATLGPIGYLPAPGTCATVATIPLVWLLTHLSFAYYLIILIFLYLVFHYIVHKALSFFPYQTDPSEIVVDELIGFLFTFLCVPYSLYNVIIGVVLFRFFDIVKPLGINRLQQLPAAWGILVDDAVAGIISGVFLWGFDQYIIPLFYAV